MDIIERLDGPHEWGYRGLAGEVFIHDPAPNDAAREIERLRAALKEFTELKEYAKSLGQETYLELHAKNERLRAALKALVDNVLDYERVNNFAPSPGRKYCWDTVAHAVEILNEQNAN